MFSFDIDENRLCVTLAAGGFYSQISYYAEDGEICKIALIGDIATISEFISLSSLISSFNPYRLCSNSSDNPGFLELSLSDVDDFSGKFTTECFEVCFSPTKDDLLSLRAWLSLYLEKLR